MNNGVTYSLHRHSKTGVFGVIIREGRATELLTRDGLLAAIETLQQNRNGARDPFPFNLDIQKYRAALAFLDEQVKLLDRSRQEWYDSNSRS